MAFSTQVYKFYHYRWVLWSLVCQWRSFWTKNLNEKHRMCCPFVTAKGMRANLARVPKITNIWAKFKPVKSRQCHDCINGALRYCNSSTGSPRALFIHVHHKIFEIVIILQFIFLALITFKIVRWCCTRFVCAISGQCLWAPFGSSSETHRPSFC